MSIEALREVHRKRRLVAPLTVQSSIVPCVFLFSCANASLAERSKATDLSPVHESVAGSSPAGCNFFRTHTINAGPNVKRIC